MYTNAIRRGDRSMGDLHDKQNVKAYFPLARQPQLNVDLLCGEEHGFLQSAKELLIG